MRYTPTGLKWGFQAEEVPAVRQSQGQVGAPGCPKLQYMKLLLNPSQEKTGQGRVQHSDPLGLAQMRLALPPGKLPVDVVSDYLKCLKDHALDVMSNSLGTDFWRSIPIEYYLTIPAVYIVIFCEVMLHANWWRYQVWSEAAKALTLQAAERAGVGSKNELVLISEPEAVSLACLTDMYHDLLKVSPWHIYTYP